jgi:hypothetical protein
VAVSTRQARLELVPARALMGVVVVFAVALAVLGAIRHERAESERLPRDPAVRAALDDASVRAYLADAGFTRERVTPIDDRLVRVSFFDGPRIVLEVAVAPDGRAVSQIVHRADDVRLGGEVAQRPLVLALLLAVFALATVTLPLRSMRNLDVLALASFVVPIVLLNERLLEASVYASYPPLAYLCIRCGRVGFRPRREADASQPLAERFVPCRVLAFGTVAAAVMLMLLAIPGGLVGDVAFASMAGATDLVHGTLPYGHLTQTELVHGDTYPLLAYAAYIPAALVTPVETGFDQLDGALWVASAFALAAAVAMHRIGGWRLALAWLCFPPVLVASSAGTNDLAAAALVAWAVASVAYAGRSSAALALAASVKLAPVAALPVWLLRERGGGLVRAALGATAAAAAVVIWVIALGGVAGLGDMADALSFQAERGSLLSLWSLADAALAQLAVQAAVVTLVVVSAVQARRDATLACDPRRICALAAAALIGVQLGANYWSYAYLPWVFPLVAVALLVQSRAATS